MQLLGMEIERSPRTKNAVLVSSDIELLTTLIWFLVLPLFKDLHPTLSKQSANLNHKLHICYTTNLNNDEVPNDAS